MKSSSHTFSAATATAVQPAVSVVGEVPAASWGRLLVSSVRAAVVVMLVGGIAFTGLTLYTTHARTAPARKPA